jgi:hypothetical protein
MKTLKIAGMDEFDVYAKLWNWRTANPNAVVVTQHPIQRLPLSMKQVAQGEKIEFQCSVLLFIDFTEAK